MPRSQKAYTSTSTCKKTAHSYFMCASPKQTSTRLLCTNTITQYFVLWGAQIHTISAEWKFFIFSLQKGPAFPEEFSTLYLFCQIRVFLVGFFFSFIVLVLWVCLFFVFIFVFLFVCFDFFWFFVFLFLTQNNALNSNQLVLQKYRRKHI